MKTAPAGLPADVSANDLDRRRVVLGLLALLGSGALVDEADALPRNYAKELAQLNRALQKYGLQIGGVDGLKEDLVSLTVHPLPATEYVHTIELPDDLGAIIPCVKTSYFAKVTDFVHLMPGESGEATPCYRTRIAHEHDGDIIPCVSEHYDATGAGALFRATVVHEHEAASFAVLDAGAAPDSAAPLALDAEWTPDGNVASASLTIGQSFTDREVPLRITVGSKTYELKGGELVET